MAVTHTAAIRNAIANVVTDAVDVGGANPNGQLVIFDINNVPISIMQLQNPSFQNAVNGTCVANAPANDPAPVLGGVPYRFEVQDCGGNWVFRGSCGPSGDLGAPGTPIIVTEVGACTQLVYNAPA
jgi:hypothetical protein